MTVYLPPPAAVERFWTFWEDRDGCREWTRATCNGYGHFTFREGGKRLTWRAHRLAWTLTHGPIPEGLDVLHTCDNPPCGLDEHLYLGDDLANVADRKAKDRGVRGERVNTAKLTEVQVHELRALWAEGGWTKRALSQRFGVSDVMVGLIVRGKNWVRS